jgi:predicted nucleic acid-binding protein
VSSVIVFDTSIFIDQLRTGRHTARIQAVTGLIRTSVVVLAELWRGATTNVEHKFLHALERNHQVLATTVKNWVRSGQLLARIRIEKGFSPEKLRDLHFDARLITSNRADFELIRKYIPVQLEIWR